MANKTVSEKYELLIENLLLHLKLNKIRKMDLSERSGIHYSQMSRYFNLHNEIPLKVFLQLCEAADISLTDLEHYQEDAPPPSTVKKELAAIKKLVVDMSQKEFKKAQ